MALYIVKFKAYQDEVKFGLSTNLQLRLRSHLQNHGEIDFAYSYQGADSDDKRVEREILKKYRNKEDKKDVNKFSRDGWTEFLSISLIDLVEEELSELGYVKTVISDIPRLHPDNPVRAGKSKKGTEIKKALRDIQTIDAMILCVLTNNQGVFPETRQEFDELMSSIGETTDWYADLHYDLAKEFSEYCSGEGILSLNLDLEILN